MFKKILAILFVLLLLTSCSFIEKTFSTKLDYDNYKTYYDIKISTSETSNFSDVSPNFNLLKKGITVDINFSGSTQDYEYHEAYITLLLTNNYEAYNSENQTTEIKRFKQYVTIYPNIRGESKITKNYIVSEISDGFKYAKNITDRGFQIVGIGGYLKRR